MAGLRKRSRKESGARRSCCRCSWGAPSASSSTLPTGSRAELPRPWERSLFPRPTHDATRFDAVAASTGHATLRGNMRRGSAHAHRRTRLLPLPLQVMLPKRAQEQQRRRHRGLPRRGRWVRGIKRRRGNSSRSTRRHGVVYRQARSSWRYAALFVMFTELVFHRGNLDQLVPARAQVPGMTSIRTSSCTSRMRFSA